MIKSLGYICVEISSILIKNILKAGYWKQKSLYWISMVK